MRRLALSVIFSLSLLSTGCVSKSESNGVSTYSYAWWVLALTVLVLAVVTIGGFAGRKDNDVKNKLLSWLALIGGPICGILFLPDLFMDRVTIEASGFKGATGFWFSAKPYDVRFSEAKGLDFETRTSRGRRGRTSTSTDIVVTKNSGEKETIRAGTILKQALPEIEEKATAAGFNFEGGGNNKP